MGRIAEFLGSVKKPEATAQIEEPKVDETITCPMCGGGSLVDERVALAYFGLPELKRGTKEEKQRIIGDILGALERDKRIRCPMCAGSGRANRDAAKAVFGVADMKDEPQSKTYAF